MLTEIDHIYRISKHGKFRVEGGGYILLCHCKFLQDFRLPLHHLGLLQRLTAGVGVRSTEELSLEERALIDDLRAVQLLDDAKPTLEMRRAQAASMWDRVAYAEAL